MFCLVDASGQDPCLGGLAVVDATRMGACLFQADTSPRARATRPAGHGAR